MTVYFTQDDIVFQSGSLSSSVIPRAIFRLVIPWALLYYVIPWALLYYVILRASARRISYKSLLPVIEDLLSFGLGHLINVIIILEL